MLNPTTPAKLAHVSIENLPFLSDNECEKIQSALIGLRSEWEPRTPLVPFYTLGSPSYLDAKKQAGKGENFYVSRANHFNPILREHFGWLYDRLAAFLAQRLGAPTTYRSNGSLPGFNIFLAHKAFTKMRGSIHADYQYLNLTWDWAKNVSQEPISFTLAIKLPHTRSGIDIWDISEEQVRNLAEEEVVPFLEAYPHFLFAYEVGCVTLHFGHVIHQVPPAKDVVPGEARVTLQGHGLLCDGVWHLYW